MKMMSDCFTSAARLIWATPSDADNESATARSITDQVRMGPSLRPSVVMAERDAEEERIDRDGHRAARATEQLVRREIHPALIHHALREVGGIGRVARGEYAEELVPAGEETVVVADVRQELEGRRRGRHGGEHDVL